MTATGQTTMLRLEIETHRDIAARVMGIRHKSPKDRDSVVMDFRDSAEAGSGAAPRLRELLGLDP